MEAVSKPVVLVVKNLDGVSIAGGDGLVIIEDTCDHVPMSIRAQLAAVPYDEPAYPTEN